MTIPPMGNRGGCDGATGNSMEFNLIYQRMQSYGHQLNENLLELEKIYQNYNYNEVDEDYALKVGTSYSIMSIMMVLYAKMLRDCGDFEKIYMSQETTELCIKIVNIVQKACLIVEEMEIFLLEGIEKIKHQPVEDEELCYYFGNACTICKNKASCVQYSTTQW